ncbi:MAG: phosphoribosyltransferase family protein [bacterium]
MYRNTNTKTNITKNIASGVLDYFFPIHCVNCKKGNSWLCQDCLEKTALLNKIICLYCKKATLDGYTHKKCFNSWRTERTLSVIPFRFPWREVLHTLKFYRYGPGTKSIIEELLWHWRAEKDISIPKEFWIMPLPLHWQRRFFREFNQAEEIAKVLAKAFTLKMSPVFMYRNTNTVPQSGLYKEDRRRNVRGVFEIREKDKGFIRGRSFLLVDDVITSGATMIEATRTLKKAGAARVWCFSLARA